MSSLRVVRIGTRGSALARWQANWVAREISRWFPRVEVLLVTLRTQGDRILDAPLFTFGGKGLFVREIDEALLRGEIDLAVHSMKDLPAELPQGLSLAAIPAREDPSDVLISVRGGGLEDLPEGATVGTSSLRRKAQLLHMRPDLQVVDLRGNVDTRLRKLESRHGGLEAIVLAAAGIKRMGLWSRVTQVLDPGEFLPAIGQGALAVETRSQDHAVRAMIEPLDDPETRACVMAERAVMRQLQGGCQVPMAALARVEEGGRIRVRAMVAGLNGKPMFKADVSRQLGEAEQAGMGVAQLLVDMGARELLDQLRVCCSLPSIQG